MSGRLSIVPCSHFMAKQAVGRWHYSRNMPASSEYAFAVTEDDRFVGCVLFGSGSTPAIGGPFGLSQESGAILELLRVALCTTHRTPVSRIISVCIRLLRQAAPRLRLLVSYADKEQGHHGGIYQAGNWVYVGMETQGGSRRVILNGVLEHPRALVSRYGTWAMSWLRDNVDPNARMVHLAGKHKYVYPLDAEMRAIVAPLSKPYPRRAESIVSDAASFQLAEGGARPTSALDLFGDAA